MRSLMWFSLGFSTACAVGAWLFRGTVLMILAAAALLGAVGLRFLGQRNPKLLPTAVLLLGMAAGCLWFQGFDSFRISPVRALDGKEQVLTVEISTPSWDTEYGTAVKGRTEISNQNYALQLYLNQRIPLSPGDRVRCNVRLRLTDTGGAKKPTFHRGNGILLLAYQKGEAEIFQGTSGISDYPQRFRQRLLQRIGEVFPEDTAGFAKALLLGFKEDLTYSQQTDFNVAGIAHIVAVSGLHLSILFLLIYNAAGKGRFLTGILGIPAALFFAAVVGWTPSVTRAAIMQTVFMLSLAADREYDPPTSLSAAVLVMLLWNPLVITSVGFELSVTSVAGILLFYRPIRDWLRECLPATERKVLSRLRKLLCSSVAVTTGATLISAPLAAVSFGCYPLIGVMTNLLVVPLVSVIFYGILLSCVVSLFWTGGAVVLGSVVSVPIRMIFGISHSLGSLPLAAIYPANPYFGIWMIALYGLIFCVMVSRHRRVVLAGGLAVAGLFLSAGLAWAEPRMDSYRVTVLDVGQGQCVLLQSDGRSFLVDCGGDYDENAADLAAQTLLSMGIRRIDGMLLSHYDRDHTGGAGYFAQRIAVDQVYLPVPRQENALSVRVQEELKGIPFVWLEEDQVFSIGTAQITIFAPMEGSSDNERCAAVLFQRGKYDTLITGDLPASGELALLERGVLPDLEVLVVGHHGSNTSTCAQLLEQCAPDVAIISCGAGNSYGHPAPQVLGRLREAGCAIFRTDQMGTITYRRGADGKTDLSSAG